MQKFDKPVKEYHKISEEFPVFQTDGKRGTLLHYKCIQFKQVIKTSINYFIMKRRQVILYPCLPEAFLSELCLPCPCLL